MKVLFATMQFGRGYGQGAERYLAMLLDGLRIRGHEGVVLAGDPEGRGPGAPLGAEVQREPRVLAYPSPGWLSVEGLPAAKLAGVLARETPDIVHLVNPGHIGVGLLSAARAAKIHTVVTVVDYWWICPKHTLLHDSGRICDARVPWRECLRCIAAVDVRPRVRAVARVPLLRGVGLPIVYFGKAAQRGQRLADIGRWRRRQTHLRQALDSVDDVIFLSRSAQERLSAGLTRPRQHLVPVGMEPRWFAAARPARDPGPRDPSQITIGFAGALAPHKGPHLLLAAVRRLGWTGTRVVLAGGESEPEYSAELRAAADGLRVEFAGLVPSERMPAWLAALDVLVVPSTWPENQPQIVLEALAVGTPVLAAAVAGIQEVLPDPAALFDVNSADSLAARLAAWLHDPRMPTPTAPVSTADEMVSATLRVYQRG